MKRWLPGLLCMVLSGVALAAGPNAASKRVQAGAGDQHARLHPLARLHPNAASKRVQASMLVTGTIEVAPDGSVAQYALDHPDELPPAVKGLLAKAIPSWKFE